MLVLRLPCFFWRQRLAVCAPGLGVGESRNVQLALEAIF
jgi:hypothetical protein